MRKNAFNAQARISAINKFRIAMEGKPFTKEQLLNMFRENSIPSNSTFWSVFRKSGIIKELGKGQYTFTTGNPIPHKDLDTIYRRYSTLLKQYAKSRKPTKTSKPEEKEEFNLEEALKTFEYFAIDFLKEKGYKIMAPIATIYKEI